MSCRKRIRVGTYMLVTDCLETSLACRIAVCKDVSLLFKTVVDPFSLNGVELREALKHSLRITQAKRLRCNVYPDQFVHSFSL